MSLESISRVVSNALKAAAAVSGGTPDEKGALDVLGGLAELLDSRIQLHNRATFSAGDAEFVNMRPKPVAEASNRAVPKAAAPGDAKPRTLPDDSDNSYDLK